MNRMVVAVVVCLLAGGCAPRPIVFPTGSGTPLIGVEGVFAQAASPCVEVRTMTAELGLAGRVGANVLRGRVHAGLARPASVRLEGVAPFGPPAFILAARSDRATLWFPRDERVLTGKSTAAILEALAGLPLGADDLRAILAGCVTADPQPRAGRTYGDWIAVDLGEGVTAYLKVVDGAWRIVAGTRPALTVEYRRFLNGRPRHVRVRTITHGNVPDATMTVTLSQVQINGPLNPAAFDLVVPPTARPLTLEDVRRAGLGAGTRDDRSR